MRFKVAVISVSVICLLGKIAPASAQPAVAERGAHSVLEEVLVTAQKREERLIDVPVSVAAYSAQDVVAARVNNLQDLTTLSPNLLVQRYSNATSSAVIIRGVGTATADPGFEPSVAVSVDGVYRGVGASTFNDFGDIERIEVLRGPQSAVFGKNAAIGAVNVITARPSYQWGGGLEATYGNYDTTGLRGTLTGPIVDDRVAFRLAATYRTHDGYLKNLLGPDQNAIDHAGARAQLLFDLSEATSLRIVADYTRNRDDAYSPVIQFVNTRTTCEPAAPNGRGAGDFFPGSFTPPAFLPFCAASFGNRGPMVGVTVPGFESGTPGTLGTETGVFVRPEDRTVALTIGNSEELDDRGAALEFTHDFGAIDFTLLGSRRFTDHPLVFNLGFLIGSPPNRTPALAHEDDDFQEDSVEFRFSNEAGSTLEWLFGGIYYDQEARVTGDFVQYGSTVFRTSDNQYTDRVWSAYGQATWHATDRLSFIGGLRHLDEAKQVDYSGTFRVNPPPTFAATVISRAIRFETDDDPWTGSFAIRYKVGDAGNIYARYARGSKSAGAPLAGTPAGIAPTAQGVFPTPAISPIFEAETIDSYEIGTHLTLLDERLLLSGDVFWQELKDQQLQAIRPGDLTPTVLNAAHVRSTGLEVDYTYVPVPRLKLAGGLIYLDSVYESFPNAVPKVNSNPPAAPLQDLTGKTPYQAPKWTITGSVEYTLPLAGMYQLVSRAGYRYVSSYFPDSAQNAIFRNDATTFLDGSLMLSSGEAGWSIQLWGKNLTDEISFQSGQTIPTTHSTYVYLNEPRTYGVTLSYQW